MSNAIYNIGLSGLQAAQMGIATTSQNISNQSTPGYSVESAVYSETSGQYSSSGYIGGGVTTATVQRAYSQYLSTALNNAQSTNSSLTASYTLATQLNNLIGSPTGGIASAISAVFTGFQNVSNNASSVATRQTALSSATSLADQLNLAGQQYDSIRQSVNTQLTNSVTQINTYSQQIAQLNTQIQAASASGQPPNQLLDQRDQAVASLAQLVGVQTVSNSSGYSVFLSNGQPLVVGSSNFQLTTQTSASDPTELSVAYQGLGTAANAIQMPDSALAGGTVGGLLSFRSGTLDPAEAQLGAIATSFAAQVNGQNSLGLTLSGTAGGALFSVGNSTVYANAKNTGGAALTASITNPASPPTDDYKLSFDGSNYTLTDTTTNQTVLSDPNLANVAAAGNLTLTLNGSMNAGDSFTIQPTRGALNSFAVATSDPSAIAAAAPVLVSAGTTNAGTATVTQGSVTTGYGVPNGTKVALTYTAPSSGTVGTLSGFPPDSTVSVTLPGGTTPTVYTIDASGNPSSPIQYDSTTGATFSITNTDPNSLTGVSFTLTGAPSNNDTFTIASNTGGTSDGRNALAMSNLTSSTALGNNTLTTSYANYVNSVGNTVNQLKASSTSQTSVVTQLTSQQQSVSGVNLDEEAANLLQYQQLYQANSKVIQTASSLFQTLLGIFQ